MAVDNIQNVALVEAYSTAEQVLSVEHSQGTLVERNICNVVHSVDSIFHTDQDSSSSYTLSNQGLKNINLKFNC